MQKVKHKKHACRVVLKVWCNFFLNLYIIIENIEHFFLARLTQIHNMIYLWYHELSCVHGESLCSSFLRLHVLVTAVRLMINNCVQVHGE